MLLICKNRRLRSRICRFIFQVISIVFILCITIFIYKSIRSYWKKPPTCSELCSYSSLFTKDALQFNFSHSVRHFPHFVCPQNFRNLADWIYGWPDQFLEHLETTTDQGKEIAPCLPSGSIIYVRIWVIDEFFAKVYPHLQNNFVLITGEGDMSSPTHLKLLEAPDSKIIHWFGQNGQYDVSKSKKFTHLPIGINCYYNADAMYATHSQLSSYTLPPVFNEFDEPSAYIQPQDVSQRALSTTISPNSLVLLNFDPVTDRTHLRVRLMKTLCPPKNRKNFTYVRCIYKPNGIQIHKLPNIYANYRQYPFWLSPRGGGLDCHRTWEALYLDIIPIVWNNSLNVLYENLPVVIINGYEELNEKFLYEKLNEISKKKLSKEKVYQFEKLRNAYWRRLILDKSRHKDRTDVNKRENLCWRADRTFDWKRFIPFA